MTEIAVDRDNEAWNDIFKAIPRYFFSGTGKETREHSVKFARRVEAADAAWRILLEAASVLAYEAPTIHDAAAHHEDISAQPSEVPDVQTPALTGSCRGNVLGDRG